MIFICQTLSIFYSPCLAILTTSHAFLLGVAFRKIADLVVPRKWSVREFPFLSARRQQRGLPVLAATVCRSVLHFLQLLLLSVSPHWAARCPKPKHRWHLLATVLLRTLQEKPTRSVLRSAIHLNQHVFTSVLLDSPDSDTQFLRVDASLKVF